MRIGIRVEKKPVKSAGERVREIAKSLGGAAGIEKGRGHKYVKREGSPGNYTYYYQLPDGRIGTREDLDAALKKQPGKAAPVPAASGTTNTGGNRVRKPQADSALRGQTGGQAMGPQKQDNGSRGKGNSGNGGGSFAGSIAVGDLITGAEANTGKELSGKVTAKGKDGITILTDADTTHYVEWGGIETVDQPVNDQDAIRMIYDQKAIKGGFRDGTEGFQPESCDTIDGLLKAAGVAREDLNRFSAGYAKRFRSLDPILIKRPVLKGIDRIKEKLRDDDKGGNCFEPPDTYHARTIRDTDGHTFTLNNVADVGKMLAAFNKDKNVIRVKNNFAKPNDLGYSDINMNIRLPNGTIAEIQLNTTANLVAKERYGHSLYEVHRSLKDKEGYKDLVGIMEDAQRALYGLSNRDSRRGTYKPSEAVSEAIRNGDTGAIFKEEHKEYADVIKPFVKRAIPMFKRAEESGDIDPKVAGHFRDLVKRLKNT